MKYAVTAILALFVGMVIGGMGPKWDLSKAKEEIAELERSKKHASPGAGNLDGITKMLKIKDMDEVREAAPLRKTGNASPKKDPAAPVNVPEQTAVPVASNDAVSNDSSMSNNIETAAVIWGARVEMARNNFIANSELKKDEVEMFDTVMEAMNIRLEYSISQWVEKIKEKDQISSEDGLRILKELSEAVVVAYDDMDKAMPKDWRDRAGSEFEMVDFIDPAVAKPLVGMEDRMPHGWGPPREGRRNRKQPEGSSLKAEVGIEK